jgi:hypothetical protein
VSASTRTIYSRDPALRSAGLVNAKRVGQWQFFKRDEAAIQALINSLRRTI